LATFDETSAAATGVVETEEDGGDPATTVNEVTNIRQENGACGNVIVLSFCGVILLLVS